MNKADNIKQYQAINSRKLYKIPIGTCIIMRLIK